jgi:hypothetical protein
MPDLGSYLFETFPGEPGLFTYLATGIFIVGLAAGLFVYFRRQALFGDSPALARVAGRAGFTSAILSAFGLLFALFSFLQVPLLAARFWMAGLLLTGLILIVYLIYYLRVKLPPLLAHYRQEQLRQRFMPHPAERRAARKKGKKRK